MNLLDMKRKNSLMIYQSIISGANTIDAISKERGISRLTISELARELEARNIIDISKPRRNMVGRRRFIYKPSHKYFSIFIEKQKEFFSAIAITTEGKAIERYDFPLNYENRTCQDVLDTYVLKKARERDDKEFCMAIYLLGAEKGEFVLTDDVILTTKEELIAKSMSNDSLTKLFVFNGQCIMSLYSHIHLSSLSKEELCKAINFHEILTFNGELYFESFEALKYAAIKNLEYLI